MRKMLLLIMMCIPAVLIAQNGVDVSNLEMGPGVVTFDIAWNKDAMPETVWSDTVWVWVDYNNAGVMQRLPLSAGATLTATSAPGVGKVEEVPGNNKGVWVIGNTETNSSFSATVRLLTAATNTAGACAYASNYRPRGKYTSDNDILFTGTPLYTIVLVPSGGGSPITPMVGGSYRVPDNYTLQSFTDKTGAPGLFNCIPIGNIAISAPASVPKSMAVSFAVIQDGISVPDAVAITYTWSAPDFLPPSGSGTFYTPTAPANTGTYSVTLTARSTGYCDKTVTKNVTVLDCLPANDIHNLEVSATEYCEGTSLTFTLSSTTLGRTYQLYKDGNPVMNPLTGTGSAAAFVGAFDGGGVYTAQVVAGGGNCAALMNGMYTVSMKSLPVAPTITKPNDVCLNGGDIVFTASDYSGTLEWFSDGGGVVTGNTVTFVSGAATGTKTVVASSMQVHSATLTCYSSTVTQSATVNPIPGVPVTGTGVTQCGGTFSITAGIGSGGSGIRWTDDNTTVSPRIVDASGTYYAVTTSDEGCESGTASVLVTINPLPTVESVNSPPRCGEGTVTLSATPSGSATIDWYDDPTGGDALVIGYPSYPTYVTESTTYYAQARIAATNCVSASRTPVVATIIPAISPGTITSGATFATAGVDPNVTIESTTAASGGSGSITYEWRRTGASTATFTGANATYTIGSDATNYSTPGTYYFNRYAQDMMCPSIAPVAADGTYTLKVLLPCLVPDAINAGSFENFPATYSASTFVKLTDTRDSKEYTVVKIAGRWIMAQNLNYQKDLQWQEYANQPTSSTVTPATALNSFWCPGGNNGGDMPTSTQASCDVWGALYTWETAMMLDGKWTSSAKASSSWSEPNPYATNTTSGNTLNHARSDAGAVTGGRGICPPNWHVPTDGEWGDILNAMETETSMKNHNEGYSFQGMNAGARSKSKCTCVSGNCSTDEDVSWNYSIEGAQGIDAYGFRVLPAGFRSSNGISFANRGAIAIFWSSSAQNALYAWYRQFPAEYALVRRYYTTRSYGLSVRCIRDAAPAAPTGVDGARCGAGTVTISASSSSAVEIDWYNAPAGGTSLWTGETFTPNVSGPTTYYAEARAIGNPLNVSTSRTPVMAMMNSLPAAPSDVIAESRCGAGTLTISATVPGNCTVDWYAAPAGGTVTPDGAGKVDYIVNLPSQEVITYYAEARNSLTGCVSASRTPVEILLPEPPSQNYWADLEYTKACTSGTVTVTGGFNPGSGAVYEWGLGNGIGDVPVMATTSGNSFSTSPVGVLDIYFVRMRGTDGACSTTITSARTFTISTYAYPPVSAGVISYGNTTTFAGTDPDVTITSSTPATGGSSSITYEWRRTGTSNATLTGANATYTIGSNAANYSTPGTYYFNRYAKDAMCNTPWVAASGTYTLRVLYPCPVPEATNAGSFANFPATYSASTFVKLTDTRDSKEYTVVKIANRWIMAQNLNYQKDLTWQANANQPTSSTVTPATALSSFWCPGGNSGTAVSTSTQASCDVWGALYTWETAMMLDGKWTSSAKASSSWSEPNPYATNTTSGNTLNHARSDVGAVTGGRGICPPNWHVPTDGEWGDILNEIETGTKNHNESYNTLLGMNAGARSKSKCTCMSGSCSTDEDVRWRYYETEGVQGTDAYGFRVLPAGYRYNNGIAFAARGLFTFFWTSSAQNALSAWYREFYAENALVKRDYTTRSYGFSVRCIRNAAPAAPTAVNGARCGAGTVTISASSSSPGVEIDWYTTATGGTSIHTGATYTPNVNVSGTATYYAEARVIGSPNNVSPRTPVTVTMFLMPEITTQPRTPVEACRNGSVKLSVAATNASGYQWKRGSANVSGGSGGTSATYTTATFTSLTSYTYTVVVSNGTGPGSCTVTSSPALVTVYSPTAPGSTLTFENFHPCSAPVGSTWSLWDTRESGNQQLYKVRMMADQRVWMVQDLKFGDKCGTKEAFTTYMLVDADETGNLSTAFPGYYGDCTNKKDGNTPTNRGYLYTWAAAVNHAGAFYSSNVVSDYLGCGDASTIQIPDPAPPRNLDPNACQGICPAGWHLPTGNRPGGVVGEIADANTKFQAYSNYNCTGAACWNASSQWEGVLGGISLQSGSSLLYGNSRGEYWSSTRNTGLSSLALEFGAEGVAAGNTEGGAYSGLNFKYFGGSVRCIRNYY